LCFLDQEETTEAAEPAPSPKQEPSAAATSEPEKEGENAPTVDDSKPAAVVKEETPPPPSEEEIEEQQQKSKRVYVGNLAWEVTWQELKDHVKEAGLDVKIASVMTTPDGRSKGCGIVEFNTAADAQQAVLTLNDTELHGRQIFVREDREEQRSSGGSGHHQPPGTTGQHHFSSGEQAKSRRVYVGNLSWDVAWQDLKDHMREAGEVIHAEVIREHNGRSKGCGIVEFASEEDAQNAISTLTDTELKGRMIFVREDRETSSQASLGGGASGVGRGHQNTSVYVWNLTPETSWQDLKDHMRKAGNVDSATILTNAQGESVCCGVVVYQRSQEAVRAIRELQNSELKGQPIYVREDRVQGSGGGRGFVRGGGRGGGRGRSGRGSGRGGGRGNRSGGDQGTQVYVGNLSPETTWRELKDHFRQCGEVTHAEVKTNYQGQSKGFGIVTFSSKEEADTAISRLNSSELQGSELEVRLDQRAR
jgi:RNA recognition motif-containing protein